MRAAVALPLGLVLCPVVMVVLRRLRALDQPGDRSSHRHPTIRGGGVAPAVAAIAVVVYSNDLTGGPLVALLVAAVAFGLLGLIEDLRGVPALTRLGGQLAIAGCVLPWLLVDLSGSLVWQLVFGAGVVLWLTSYVNAFNFMDGINGISVAQVVVAGTTWWAVGEWQGVDGVAAAGLIGALAALGFLPFNFPRARLFLGDVGSYFFGAWLAVLAVVGLRAGIAFEAMFAPLALYLADTGATLVRRMRRRETWHEPHRDHAYQHLHHDLGWSHVRTTGVVGVVMAACSVLGAVSETGSLGLRVAADVLLASLVTGYLLLPAMLGRLRSRAGKVTIGTVTA
jgi:UDP-N-acetylmuramyl pentapeptide phosphotransferase/UDP-N-acetylglucosamine-1-phosphate transferase